MFNMKIKEKKINKVEAKLVKKISKKALARLF